MVCLCGVDLCGVDLIGVNLNNVDLWDCCFGLLLFENNCVMFVFLVGMKVCYVDL